VFSPPNSKEEKLIVMSATNSNGAGGVLPVKPEAVAAQTENPSLWLFKYQFYLNNLGFNETDAIRWANRSVHIDSDVRNKLALLELKE
jgi:hypothetical protein